MAKEKNDVSPVVQVRITPPDIQTVHFICKGIAPLGICRFDEKAQQEMEEIQKAGSTSRSKKKRPPKDFEANFRRAQYRAPEGWAGIHAACIRNGLISACRTVEMHMTLAKLGVFVVADGYDAVDGTPLLRIWGPEPHMWKASVRNSSGVIDLRARPRWNPGEWELRPRIQFDAGMFTLTDVTNLMMRLGFQVGIGEGRPDSKRSAGIGYGLFEVATQMITEIAA